MPVGGARVVVGFAGLVDGPLDAPGAKEHALAWARACGFADSAAQDSPDADAGAVPALIRALAERSDRARDGVTAMTRGPSNDMAVHGPRLGDRVRLGDTRLTLEVMADDRLAGDELLLGFAKTGRDGIGFRAVRTTESCDVVVTNVLLLDPVLGVRVTSIGIREGRIVAHGRSGNPDTTDGVDVVVGSGTIVIPGEGLIATPGAVDPHVHGLSPKSWRLRCPRV